MKLTQGFGVVLLAGALLGCASEKPLVNPAKLLNFNPSAELHLNWQQKVGEMGMNVLTPGVSSRSVISANNQGVIHAFDSVSGKLLWEKKSPFPISAGVGLGESLVLVGSAKGEIAAYSEQDGSLRWLSQVSSEVLGAPQVAEGVVLVRSGDGQITGLNSQNGERLWLYERATPALVARSNAGITVHKGIIYAGFAAGKLTAIGLHTGVTIWESSVSQPRGNTELERISDITSLPIIDDTQVCATSFQGRLACFDAEQGSALWTRDIASDKGLSISRKYLFFTDTDGRIFGLDKLTGSPYWKNDQLTLRQVTAPLALAQYLLVADFESYLHVLDRDDGHFIARLKTDGSAIRSTPTASGDGFVVQTNDGGLYSIKIQSLTH
jgi:outer membrane protein assembly factor BamB